MEVETPRGTAGWVPAEETMDFTFRTLAVGPHILRDKFSSADILIGTALALFMGSRTLPKTPLLEAYVNRVIGRPAYARAMAREGYPYQKILFETEFERSLSGDSPLEPPNSLLQRWQRPGAEGFPTCWALSSVLSCPPTMRHTSPARNSSSTAGSLPADPRTREESARCAK